MSGERGVIPAMGAANGATVSCDRSPVDRSPLGNVLLLLGAAYGAILLTGTREQGALGLFLVIAGIVLVLSKPQVQLSRWTWALGGAFLGAAALSLLPLAWSQPPEWRATWQAAEEMPVSDTITPIALETLWWWALLAISVAMAFLILSRPLSSRDQVGVANAAIALTALYSVMAVFCELTGWRFPFDALPTFGFFRNRNHTATFLVIGAILALGVLGLSPQCGHRRSRALAGVALLLCTLALIFFSSSRAGIIFLGLGTTLWLSGLGRQHRRQPQYLALAGILLAGMLVFLVSGGAARQRVLGIVGLGEGVRARENAVLAQEPWDFRLLIFQDTVRIIQDHLWTGTGLGTFATVFPQYQKASLRAATAAHPESDWLMLMAEAGVPCAALLLVLIAVTCWRIRHSRAQPYWPLRWGMLCAALTAALHGLVDVPVHRIPLGWWIVLLGAASIGQRSASPLPHWAQRAVFITTGSVALAAGGMLIRAEWFQGPPAVPFVGGAIQRAVTEHTSDEQLELAIDAAEAGIDRAPLSDGLYFQLGSLLLAAGEEPEDVDQVFLAQRLLQPKWPDIPFQQGLAWLNSDGVRCAGLWKEAVARQHAIDMRTGEKSAPALFRRMLTLAATARDVQRGLFEPEGSYEFTTIWLETVPLELLEWGLQRISGDPNRLARIGPADRLRFIQLWAKRGQVETLQHFFEEQPGWKEFAWPLRLRQALDQQDHEEAVRLVCVEFGVSLELPGPNASNGPPHPLNPSEEFAHLWSRGKEISARSLLDQAGRTERVPADVYRWRAALAARDGDWPTAWHELESYARNTKRVIW